MWYTGLMPNAGLARKTRHLLATRGISAPQAAERAGVDPTVIWKMMKGRSVSTKTLIRVAAAFGEDPVEWVRVGRPELGDIIKEPEGGYSVAAEPPPREATIEQAFEVVCRDRDYDFGTRAGELTAEVKKQIVKLYEKAKGVRLLPEGFW